MKKNYFLKVALISVATFCIGNVFAQVAKTSNFVENVSPVHGVDELQNPIMEDFTFAFECGVAWGDYNNDGYLDLIVAGVSDNWAKKTILYKNDGDGKFTKVENPFPLVRVANVTWLDYNNDGNLDLFVAGQDDIGTYSALYKNLGSASNYSFQQVFDGQFAYINNGNYEGNRPNRYVFAADYDNDGWVDIYLTGGNETGRVSFLYKNLKGNGFQKLETPVNGTKQFIQMNGGSSAWGDFNRDGYLDLFSFGYTDSNDNYPGVSGSVGAVYKNNGDGTFAEPTHYEAGEEGEIAISDYNNDGYLDFLITGFSWMSGVAWQADLFENTGSSTFTRVLPATSGLRADQQNSIAWGDANNDGFEDLLYMRANPNSIYFNNTGDQTFTKYELTYTKPVGGDSEENYTYTGNQHGGSASLVDYDRDGNLDAFTAAYGFTPRLMRNILANDVASNVAPTAPTNLAASVAEGGIVTFSWDAGTDDITPEDGLKYNVYVKKDGNDTVSFVLPADLTSGRLRVNETLAPIVTKSYTMSGLANGSYTFGVQTIDNAKVASQFATAQFSVGTTPVNSTFENKIKVISVNKKIRIMSNSDLKGNVEVYSINGMLVYSHAGQISNSEINLSTGVYLVKIVSDKNTTIKRAIVE